MKLTPNGRTHGSLTSVPGIGPSIAQDLNELGIHAVPDLVGQDPEALYRDLCILRGEQVDRCVLYVFRCAVYFAHTPEPEPDRLKWWSWKDDALAGEA